MHGVHVYGDPGGLVVVARIDQDAGDFREPDSARGDHTMITTENFILASPPTDNYRHQKAISLDRLFESGLLFGGQVLRIATERVKLVKRQC